MPKNKRNSNTKSNECHQPQTNGQIELYNNLVGRRDALTNQINRFQTFLETKCTVLDNPVLKFNLHTR